MSDIDDDSEAKVRKVLRDLPRVRAKPDFEQRLARKLAEPAARSAGIFAWLNVSGRIPAPAYSAAALIILAIVSYYAFFRSGALPTPPVTSDEVSSKPAAPSDEKTGPAGKDELSAALKENGRERDKQASAGDQKRATVAQPRPAEPAQRRQEVELRQGSGITQQSAEGVSMSKLKKADKEVVPEESVKPEEAPANAPSVNFAPGQKSFAPTGQAPTGRALIGQTPQAQTQSAQASPYSVTAETFRAALDSVHIRDSLRADSLRKAKLDSLKKK